MSSAMKTAMDSRLINRINVRYIATDCVILLHELKITIGIIKLTRKINHREIPSKPATVTPWIVIVYWNSALPASYP
jgi:hypothetical protein